VARSVDLDLDLLPSTEFSTTLLDLGNETTLDRFVDEMIQRLGKERRQWELETATLKCRPPCQCIPNCSPTMAVAAEREGLSPNDDPTNNQRNNKVLGIEGWSGIRRKYCRK
jgi:hypothetical protein